MSRLALLLALSSACTVEVGTRPAETDSDRYDPAQDVLRYGRAREGIALQAALAHYRSALPGYEGVDMDPEFRVGWVAGVECPTVSPPRPGKVYIDNGSFCSNGLHRSCEEIYIVLHEDQSIAESPYAHELAHCLSTQAGFGGDKGHNGKIWSQVDEAQSAIAAAMDLGEFEKSE